MPTGVDGYISCLYLCIPIFDGHSSFVHSLLLLRSLSPEPSCRLCLLHRMDFIHEYVVYLVPPKAPLPLCMNVIEENKSDYQTLPEMFNDFSP